MAGEALYDERELLERIAMGDEFAFSKLFHHYRNQVYTVAYKLTHSASISEEIVQDVFLIIWMKYASLPEIKNFQSYLFVITQNHAFKALKVIAHSYQRNILTSENEPIAKEDSVQRIMEKEYTLLLQHAVDRLPYQQKKVFHLIKEQGLKREQVAVLLNVGSETVKFHLAEAMKSIRAFCKVYLEMIIIAAIFLFCLNTK